jgi:hypothetical protein
MAGPLVPLLGAAAQALKAVRAAKKLPKPKTEHRHIVKTPKQLRKEAQQKAEEKVILAATAGGSGATAASFLVDDDKDGYTEKSTPKENGEDRSLVGGDNLATRHKETRMF